eukprot:TRINITY_DN11756_c0_g1_i1.p1 TRINITY_DN11756_c0_g1~~TRINITY_DN11756_c0_g1_i1.p1  ORF type:complete len:497 (-),score=81.09 TRINITY_DN11756_c0_g1_i1:40-1485(-)
MSANLLQSLPDLCLTNTLSFLDLPTMTRHVPFINSHFNKLSREPASWHSLIVTSPIPKQWLVPRVSRLQNLSTDGANCTVLQLIELLAYTPQLVKFEVLTPLDWEFFTPFTFPPSLLSLHLDLSGASSLNLTFPALFYSLATLSPQLHTLHLIFQDDLSDYSRLFSHVLTRLSGLRSLTLNIQEANLEIFRAIAETAETARLRHVRLDFSATPLQDEEAKEAIQLSERFWNGLSELEELEVDGWFPMLCSPHSFYSALLRNPHLRALHLGLTQSDPAPLLEGLAPLLPRLPPLHSFKILNAPLPDSLVSSLSRTLPTWPNLTSLSLESCAIDDARLAMLLPHLPDSLVSLNLVDNPISSTSVPLLTTHLPRFASTLTDLRLASIAVDNSGARALFLVLVELQCLEMLMVDGWPVTNEVQEDLAEVLPALQRLEFLWISSVFDKEVIRAACRPGVEVMCWDLSEPEDDPEDDEVWLDTGNYN